MLDWIGSVIRSLFWILAELGFTLMDMFYGVMTNVTNINFVKSDILWKIWGTAMLFMSVAIIIRIIQIFGRMYTSEDEKDGFDWIAALVKILMVTVVMAVFPSAMKAVGEFGQWAVASAGQIAGASSNTNPSNTIVTGFISEGRPADAPVIEYSHSDIEINEKDVNGEYKYFQKDSSILLCAVFAIFIAVLILMCAFNIAKNWFGLAILIVGAFMPISSLIDPKSDMFPNWIKMLGSCYLTNFFSILLLNMVMTLSCSSMVMSNGFGTQIVVMAAGLLVVLAGVPQIQRLIGGDTGTENTLQQMFYASSMAVGLGKLAAKGAAFGMRAGTRTGAEAVYNTSKFFGGKSITDLYSNAGGGGNPINPAAFGPNSGGARTHLDTSEKVRPASKSGVELTRQGTKLGNAASTLYSFTTSTNPAVRFGAKLALGASSHIYSASINRIQRGKGRNII